ncbi:hypothetical protein C8R48DRAFT_315633 [Suillus tomentosus]|nr:hypothetical protein C8R48DRAFT_315633 [Suillus tomentosus]
MSFDAPCIARLRLKPSICQVYRKTICLPGVPCTNTVAPNYMKHPHDALKGPPQLCGSERNQTSNFVSANSFYRYHDLSGKVLQPGAISYLLSDLYELC